MFGERLKELRKEKGMTQKELGALLNISDRVIGYYEADRHFPDGDVLLKLSQIFDVSIDYLLGKTKIRKSKLEGLSEKDALSLALDTIHKAAKSGKQLNDDRVENITNVLIKRLINKGIISPTEEIDDDTMKIIKKSIEIEAMLLKSKKEGTKEK